MLNTEQMTAVQLAIGLDDVRQAAERLRGVANRTPVATSRTVEDLVGGRVFFKCENLQRGGAFKFRGAYNRLATLSAEERQRGIVAFSSGNHAQGVALAARELEVPATVVMPTDAPTLKLAATQAYGAAVVRYDRLTEDREAIARRLAEEHGLTLVPPYDHPLIMAGQGTAALELVEQTGQLDWLLLPVVVWLMLSFFEEFPRQLEQSAMLDGCGVLRHPPRGVAVVNRLFECTPLDLTSRVVTESGAWRPSAVRARLADGEVSGWWAVVPRRGHGGTRPRW